MMFCRVTVLSALVAIVTGQACQPGPVDVMFVLSSVATISQMEFNQKLSIVYEYVNSVPGTPGIGPNDVQVCAGGVWPFLSTGMMIGY